MTAGFSKNKRVGSFQEVGTDPHRMDLSTACEAKDGFEQLKSDNELYALSPCRVVLQYTG